MANDGRWNGGLELGRIAMEAPFGTYNAFYFGALELS